MASPKEVRIAGKGKLGIVPQVVFDVVCGIADALEFGGHAQRQGKIQDAALCQARVAGLHVEVAQPVWFSVSVFSRASQKKVLGSLVDEVDPAVVDIQEILASIQNPAAETGFVLQTQSMLASVREVSDIERSVDFSQCEWSRSGQDDLKKPSHVVPLRLSDSVEKPNIGLFHGGRKLSEDFNPTSWYPRHTVSHP